MYALSQCSYLAPRLGDPTLDNKKQVILVTLLQAMLVFDTSLYPHEDLKTNVFAQAILDQIFSLSGILFTGTTSRYGLSTIRMS